MKDENSRGPLAKATRPCRRADDTRSIPAIAAAVKGPSLRPYQLEAVEAVKAAVVDGARRVCVELPTGSGKTHVLAELARRAVAKGLRVLVLAHRAELLKQNAAKLALAMPEEVVGIFCAALDRREHDHRVLVASIASVFRCPELVAPRTVVIVDEAHRVPKSGDGMYRSLLESLDEATPRMVVVGLTATPYRLDGGAIFGADAMFESLVYTAPLAELIDAGFLSPLVTRHAKSSADTSKLRVRCGEFVQGEAEALLGTQERVTAAVEEVLAAATGRKAGIVFCCGVAHAGMVAAALTSADEAAAIIIGDTPQDERAAHFLDFREGRLRWLVTVDVLTEGFDAPHIDVIALLRPTASPGLYAQMVGRGLRKAPGKTDCLVLDFAGNGVRHGPLDRIEAPEPAGQTKKAKKKRERVKGRVCPECDAINLPQDPICVDCEAVLFAAKHASRPGEAPLIGGPSSGWIDVERTSYRAHEKAGAPAGHPQTLCVGYHLATGRLVREFLPFESKNAYARYRAAAWWRRRSREPVPRRAARAAAAGAGGRLAETLAIRVQADGRWLRPVAYRVAKVEDRRCLPA